MTALEITLALALVASLGLSIWLWGRLRAGRGPAQGDAEQGYGRHAGPQRLAPAPPPDPLLPVLDPAAQPLFLTTADALDVGLVVVDTAHQVRFLSPQAEQLLNSSERAVGDGLIALLRDHQADKLVGEVIADGEARETTMKPFTSGRTLRLRCGRLTVGAQAAGALLVIRDLTQLSMLERSRRDLVANVSHELRTPLASLKLLVETVQSEPPPDVARRMLGQMSHEIDAVTQLVDELHELAQIESGRVTLKLAPLDIGEVIVRALERIRPQADRKGLRVQAEMGAGLAPVLVDADRIGQVLLNLLHNAVKFTSASGSVHVRVCPVNVEEAGRPRGLPADHPVGLWVQVSVSDTGIGIPSQDLPRIFERFYKVDRARTRNAGGTGLGLAIAKHLIEGHGGRLWADSVEGRGSTFSFTLPVA
jgi:two-component system phosphate regulon sensor histidine kinase PhoR